MAEKKRVTTAPLTHEEIAESLHDIPEDEFLSRFDEIFSRDGDLPDKLEGLIILDDYMDNELREMFQSIIAQYIRPIEYTVEQIRGGDCTKRTALEGLEALAPILSASESLHYHDITENLRQIEKPLADLSGGAKRRLMKREVAELSEAWDRLDSRLRPDGDREAPGAAPLSLAGLTRLDGVTAAHVRSLRGAGLSSLQDIVTAPAADLAAVAGLPTIVAERIHAFAAGAVAVSSTQGRRHSPPVRTGWMRVHIESEVFKGRLWFELARVGRYVEPLLERLVEAEKPVTEKPEPTPRARRTKAASKKRSQ
jgi:hypothetical protein